MATVAAAGLLAAAALLGPGRRAPVRAAEPAAPPPRAAAPERPEGEADRRIREAEAMARVRRIILDSYVEPVDEEKLFYGALRGMLRELDPYSVFMTPKEYQDLLAATTGEFGGLGIEVTVRDGWLTVVTPLLGTPAFRAGILPGDRIVKIDGQETEPMTLDEAVHNMRGKPGTRIVLSLARRGRTGLLDVEIIREIIKVDSVRLARFLDEKAAIGYVSVTAFQGDTAEELSAALKRLGGAGGGLRALVLDLRVNGGGRFDAAIKTADLFLDQGVIVSTRGREGREGAVYRAHRQGTEPDYPIAVLINESSASASEIVAGALHDHRRAVLVGEKSFGKGLVQSMTELPIGRQTAGLKLTTAYYYTPSGQCIDKIGIQPDIVVPMSSDVLLDLLRRQHDEWVKQNDPNKGKQPPAAPGEAPKEPPAAPAPAPVSPVPEEEPAPEVEKPGEKAEEKDKEVVDVQLQAAVTALRAMLVDRDRGKPMEKPSPAAGEKTTAATGRKPPEAPTVWTPLTEPAPAVEEVPVPD